MQATKHTILAAMVLFAVATTSLAQDVMPWAPNLEAAQQMAARQNQLVLIHFWTPDCVPCKRLDATVFSQPAVAQAISRSFVPVKVNAHQLPATAKQLGVNRWPTDVIITPAGQVLHRQVTPQSAQAFVTSVSQVAVANANQLGTAAAGAIQGVSQQAQGYAQRAQGYAQQTQSSIAQAGSRYSSALQQQLPAQQVPVNGPVGNRFNTPPNVAGSPGPYAANNGTPPFQPVGPSQQQLPAGIGAPNQPPNWAQGQPNQPQWNNPASQQQWAQPPPQQQQVAQQQPPSVAPAWSQPPQQQQQLSQRPAPQSQPASNSKSGLNGYCPVTLGEQTRWTKGDPRWGAVHRGKTYLFVGAAEQQRFLEKPDLYAPLLSGFDPVQFIEGGQLVDGNRQHGVFYRGQVYLFTNEQSLQQFWNSPERYATAVRQAMQQATSQVRTR